MGIDDDQHLLLVVSRALYNLDQRRRLRHWKRRYSEVETRCQQLLGNSRDAIAIIKEGTYIYSNDSYAQLFGYMDSDEMLCLPVIDTIAPEDQQQIKGLLKAQYSDSTWESGQHRFKGMRGDDLPIELTVTISQIEYGKRTGAAILRRSQLLQRRQRTGRHFTAGHTEPAAGPGRAH